VTSTVILLAMIGTMWGIIAGYRAYFNRRKRRQVATNSGRETQELQAMVDAFKGSHAVSRGWMMGLMAAGVAVATALGALFISLMAGEPGGSTKTMPQRASGMSAAMNAMRPEAMDAMRPPERRHRRRMQVVIVITDDGVEPIDNPMDRCEPGKVVHVTKDGVKCLKLGSKEARAVLEEGNKPITDVVKLREDVMRVAPMRPQVMRQGFAPGVGNVGKDVAKRKGKGVWQKYAEIVYFLTTFLGVVLRFIWDHNLERRRCQAAGLATERFNFMNLVVGFFIGVAVHLLMSKAMGVGYETATFQNVLLASYNGFLWPSILKDVSEFRGLRKSDGAVA